MSRFVIRPGESDYDVQDRVQGALDLPLSPKGMEQVEGIIEMLRMHEIERIYASPTEPALSSARRIAAELDVPLSILDSLSNLDHGLWQGLCRSEIRQKQPKVFRLWEEAPESVCPPQGEPLSEAVIRVTKALRRPMRQGARYAIVAPEPMATLITCILKGERPRLGSVAPAGGQAPKFDQLEDEKVLTAMDSWSWTRQ